MLETSVWIKHRLQKKLNSNFAMQHLSTIKCWLMHHCKQAKSLGCERILVISSKTFLNGFGSFLCLIHTAVYCCHKTNMQVFHITWFSMQFSFVTNYFFIFCISALSKHSVKTFKCLKKLTVFYSFFEKKKCCQWVCCCCIFVK